MHRILVVDDDALLRSNLTALLSREGYEVVAVEDGALAIATLARERFDAVILDLMMPRMDGYKVVNFLLQKNPAVLRTVIVLTGHSETLFQSIYAFVRKPVNNAALLAVIRRCLADNN